MDNWLQCVISLGQFKNELGVDGKQYDGSPFSLFVPTDSVKCSKKPTPDGVVAGLVKVQILGQSGPLALVRLPKETFQGSEFITVKLSQLEKSGGKRKKPQLAK